MISNKNFRSIIGFFKEAIAYHTDIILWHGSNSFNVNFVGITDFNIRKIPDMFFLELQTNFKLNTELLETYFIASVDTTNYKIFTKIHFVENKYQLEISQDRISKIERRIKVRESIENSNWLPVLLINKNDDKIINCFAKTIDFEDKNITFLLNGNQKIENINYSINFPCNSLPFEKHNFIPSILREDKEGNTIFVCQLEDHPITDESFESNIKPNGANISLLFNIKDSPTYNVGVSKFSKAGFYTDLIPHAKTLFPVSFTAKIVGEDIIFKVLRRNGRFFFNLLINNSGTRVRWYNYLTRNFLNIFTSFSDVNVKSVTRLIIDANLQDKQKIQDRINLHPFIESKWAQEKKVSSTLYRWLVKDNNGVLLGHLAAMRVSSTIWAAIDNIGNQSYEGSWNKDYVLLWIKLLKEIFENSNSRSLIQWTHIRAAGVWTKFEEALENKKHLKYCDTTMMLGLFKKSYETKKLDLVFEPIEFKEASKKISGDVAKFWNNLFYGLEDQNSDFQIDFYNDYLFSAKRFSYLIKIREEESFLLSYSNHPFWSSINNSQNFCYLIPLNDTIYKDDEINSLINSVRTKMFCDGCMPELYGFLTKQIYKDTYESVNYLLEPEALELINDILSEKKSP